VTLTEHVLETSALILVQGFVEEMQFVKSSVMLQFVTALVGTLEIHHSGVAKSLVSTIEKNTNIFGFMDCRNK